MRTSLTRFVLLLALVPIAAHAQAAAPQTAAPQAAAPQASAAQPVDNWSRLGFLLGDWIGLAGPKDTELGPGRGAYSFHPDLDRKVVVRRNSSNYDSGVHHDDLMVIYLDQPIPAPRAIYFDTEGHVIHYALSFPAANTAVFESDAGMPGPRYRLTYTLEGESLNGKFEVSPPAGAYKAYMTWTSKKQ